ncbi:MAG: hypothetical protein AAGA48_20830 [Myxococcota bacterium]
MVNPYESTEIPPSEGLGSFIGGGLIGLIAWVPMVFIIGLIGYVFDLDGGDFSAGFFSVFIPGIIQLPLVAVVWWRTRGAVRRGLAVGAGIVAFINASCWGVLVLPQTF